MKLFINIGVLAGADPRTSARRGAEMNVFKTIESAWLLTDGDTIAACGEMATLGEMPENAEIINLDGRWVFPSFCDSHTHIIYAGERSGEFLDKINGLSYEEIARRGGGILNSADLLAATPEEELYRQAMERIDEVISKGTGAIEIKSGYGLTTESELKMLRVARRIKETVPLEVKTTFLGAHAVGRAYAGRQSDYVEMLCRETIPEVGRQQLADYVDVFCDRGFFTPDETSRILEAAGAYGMRPKIHANELDISGGCAGRSGTRRPFGRPSRAHRRGRNPSARPQRHHSHRTPRRLLLLRYALRANARTNQCRSCSSPCLRLQSGLIALGRYAVCGIAGVDTHASYAGTITQRHYNQRRSRNGRGRALRNHSGGEKRQFLHYAPPSPLCSIFSTPILRH